MSAPGWGRVKEVFEAALDRPPDKRAAYVRDSCGEDSELQAEVASLLATHDQLGSFAERSAIGVLGTLNPGSDSHISRVVPPGTRVGPYEVLAAIGAGGMGEVYRAGDPRLGRDVAIKVLPAAYAANADRLQRFEQEARALAALNHPNIIAIYDVGTFEGSPYLVTELLEGESLRCRLSHGPLPVRTVAQLGLQIVRGVTAAHEKGIVHRDLKPENLFVTEGEHLKILDFGLAKLAERGPAGTAVSHVIRAPVTDMGTVLGTAGYMAARTGPR